MVVSRSEHNPHGLDISAVRRSGVVLQDNKIMAGSIFDNIASGSLCTMEAAWTRQRLRRSMWISIQC